jgi:hypothetical protein
MPHVNLTKAAKLAGISRSYFHTNYIKTGKITVDRSEPKNPKVDTSEILRVFGELTEHLTPELKNLQVLAPDKNTELFVENERLKAELEGVKALIEVKNEQIQREMQSTEEARSRALSAENQYKALLEDKRGKDDLVQRLSQQLDALQQKKWWKVW